MAWLAISFRASLEPKLIVSRTDWPRELEELVSSSDLNSEDIGTIEVVRVGWGDGWYCRMRKSPRTVALVMDRWVWAKESPEAELAIEEFASRTPIRWKTRRQPPLSDFYIHPKFNMQEDGNGTAFVGLIDEERDSVFIWFYFNF